MRSGGTTTLTAANNMKDSSTVSECSIQYYPVFLERAEEEGQESLEKEEEGLGMTAGFFSSGHSCNYIAEEDIVVLFGGHRKRRQRGSKGTNRTNQFYVVNNAHLLGKEDTSSSTDAAATWHSVGKQNIKGRAGHASFVLGSALYLHGGYDSFDNVLSDLIRVDTSTSDLQHESISYEAVVPNVDRRWHCHTNVGNTLFFHGGWNGSGPLDDVIAFSLETKRWMQLNCKEGPCARRWHSLTRVETVDNQAVIFGGMSKDAAGTRILFNDLHILDLETERWMKVREKGELPSTRYRHTLTTLPGSPKQMLLLGGFGEDEHTRKTVHILHTDDMSWHTIHENRDMFYGAIRTAHGATPVGDNGIFITGGFHPEYLSPFGWLDVRCL